MATGFAVREELGRYYTFQSRLPPGEFFEIRPRLLPHNAKPITDDESGMCIGYSVSQAPGLWRIYDTDGTFVRLEEAPLESPLIDPTDIVYRLVEDKSRKGYYYYKRFTLEVVVREKDWTVTHFLYK
ncbi:hypothetical protein HL670_02528 [Serratia plymuthica]|uniref:hypothetical protein n=1 Tax=Serratia plymuthica TaxID=82996 RepID=UPI000906E7BB|nr:hypothetical protein [Serratia plymuthica]QJW55642.1 hypothetical protein HL670_02528 [Serratia plymuthica]